MENQGIETVIHANDDDDMPWMLRKWNEGMRQGPGKKNDLPCCSLTANMSAAIEK